MQEFQQVDWDAEAEEDCRQLLRLAVREDLGRFQDWTTVALVSPDAQATARVVARQSGVVAGLPAARLALECYDARLQWRPMFEDGQRIEGGTVLAEASGPARSLLTAERPLLNVLGHLSGIATLTSQYVEAVSDTPARIYDTRKTTPGWRRLEKFAVRAGGGWNHRLGLYDAVLIKDNHLAQLPAREAGTSTPSPGEAVRMARTFLREFDDGVLAAIPVEVEVDSLGQLDDVLPADPDIVLLDNMSTADLRLAVQRRDALAPNVQLEASGGVNLETVAAIASTGVDRISVGALTHSARWFDVGLDWS